MYNKKGIFEWLDFAEVVSCGGLKSVQVSPDLVNYLLQVFHNRKLMIQVQQATHLLTMKGNVSHYYANKNPEDRRKHDRQTLKQLRRDFCAQYVVQRGLFEQHFHSNREFIKLLIQFCIIIIIIICCIVIFEAMYVACFMMTPGFRSNTTLTYFCASCFVSSSLSTFINPYSS